MKNKILSMLPWKPIAIGATTLFCSLSTASAVLHIDYTETDGDVTMTFSGSLDAVAFGETPSTGSLSTGQLTYDASSFGIRNLNGSYQSTFLALTGKPSGLPFTGFLSAASSSDTTGDVVGVFVNGSNNAFWFAPVGYSLGTSLLGSVTFVGTSLAALSLPATGSGTIDFVSVGGPENTTWGINGATVPEPSSYGFLMGGCILGISLFQRRTARRP